MRLPNPYFSNIPKFGDLSIDGIFLYYECPIVFTCVDCKRSLFICVCCDMEREQRWLIAPTSIERIEGMLSQRITLKAMFKNAGGYGCVATWHSGQEKEDYSIILCSEFSDNDLADEGEFFEAVEGEFESYIQVIKNRKEYNDQFSVEVTQEQGVEADSEVVHSIFMHYEISTKVDYIRPMFNSEYMDSFFGDLIKSDECLLVHALDDIAERIARASVTTVINNVDVEPELETAA